METRNFKTSFNLQRVREDSGLMKLFMFHDEKNLGNRSPLARDTFVTFLQIFHPLPSLTHK